MDNDLMARRLRPPSEPVHEAPAPVQEAAAFAGEEPLVQEQAATPRPPESGEAERLATGGSAADPAVTNEADASEAVAQPEMADVSGPPWEFEPVGAEASGPNPSSDEPEPAEMGAAEAQPDADMAWAEPSGDVPWADTAQQEAPWADTAQQEAPWADTAQHEALWTDPGENDAPWDRPADASRPNDTFDPDRPAWNEPRDESWPESAPGMPDPQASAADPDDAMAPVLAGVTKPIDPLWPSLNGNHAASLEVDESSEIVGGLTAGDPSAPSPESVPSDYDPTADFDFFASDVNEPSTGPAATEPQPGPSADTTETQKGVDEATQPPAPDTLGPTPPADLFAWDDEPAQAPVADGPTIATTAPTDLEPFEPLEPPLEADQPERPPDPPTLAPMVTAASANTSPGNPANHVVRVELTFAEGTPDLEDTSAASRGATNGSLPRTAPSGTSEWTEPGDAWSSAPDDRTRAQPSADADPWQTSAGRPSQPSQGPPGGAQPDEAVARATFEPLGDPLSTVPAAPVDRGPRPAGTPALAAAMSVGPADAPAIKIPGLWSPSRGSKHDGASLGVEQDAGTEGSSRLMTAALTLGLAGLVVVLVLVFMLLITSAFH